MTRHIITVDGIDGSGKSHLAQQTVETAVTAGVRALLARVDDFRRPIHWDRVPDQLGAYYDDYFDLDQVSACLDAFAGGAASFAVPTFDSITEQPAGHRALSFDDAELLVLEGVFIARVLGARSATRVYIDTSEREARRRIMERDQKKGRTAAEVERRIEQRYFAAQRVYNERHDPKGGADIVVTHEQLGAPRLARGEISALPAPARKALAWLAS